MIASIQVIVPPLAVVLFLAFLVLLAIIARIAGSATRGPKGGERGCLGGCGLFAVILLCCGLAIAGFVAFVATLAGVTAIEHNPIRRIEGFRVPDGERLDTRRGERLYCIRFDVSEPADDAIAAIKRLLRLDERHDLRIDVERLHEGSRVELTFPVSARDLEELDRNLERLGVDPPDGVRIELKDRGFPR
jgi:hypothetical protein